MSTPGKDDRGVASKMGTAIRFRAIGIGLLLGAIVLVVAGILAGRARKPSIGSM